MSSHPSIESLSKPMAAAVIGTGFIGPVHVEGLRRIGVPIRGILGTSPEKSRSAADRLGLAKGYGSLDELLSDEHVRVVHITSPNRFHYQQTLAAFRAGKHVLCEKPLAMDSSESATLCRAADDMGLVGGVNYNIRYYPLCIEVATRIRRGELGRVYHVNGSYVQDWLHRDTDFNWRVLANEGGPLRAVADIGTHWLDLIRFLVGEEIQAVCADLLTVHPVRRPPGGTVTTFSKEDQGDRPRQEIAIDTEDYGSVLFRFASGGCGSLYVSQVASGFKNCLRFEVAGEKEAVAWNSQMPNQLWVGHRGRANEELLRDPSLLGSEAARHADYPGGHNEGFPDTFKQLFKDFYGYLAVGDLKAPRRFPTFRDGDAEIRLCEAILQSSRQQQWATVKPFGG